MLIKIGALFMDRVFNFSAGPAVLPLEVLERAQEELVSYPGSGMSVLEMSHRSNVFERIIAETEQRLRVLMDIPSNYKVLFLQGGASMQFSMIPLNLKQTGLADYIVTGQFAKKAAEEARKVLTVNVSATSEDKAFSYIPDLQSASFTPNADYVHYTENNTIYGTCFKQLPKTGNVPLVVDVSSSILSETIDVQQFGLLYAGAQKNIGPAGLTIVIVRDDLIGRSDPSLPSMLSYETHARNDSMHNTPPTFAIYIANLVFKWLEDMGGVTAIAQINREKAAILYDCLDKSKLFKPIAAKSDRSIMNVTFVTGRDELDKKFIQEAEKAGMVNLAGHRSVGGMRASIYNAMPIEGVQRLTEFIEQFELLNA